MDPNGKIVVGGEVYTGAARGYDFTLARYEANGTLDTSFSGDDLQTTQMRSGSSGDSNAKAMALQTDGKLVVAGSARRGTTTKDDIAVARYLSNGNLDTAFDGDGKAYVNFSNYDYGTGLAIQSDGNPVIAGEVNSDAVGGAADFGVMRLTTAGKLDTSFDGDGKLTTSFITYEFAKAVSVQAPVDKTTLMLRGLVEVYHSDKIAVTYRRGRDQHTDAVNPIINNSSGQ